MRFFAPDKSDKRIEYACKFLEEKGIEESLFESASDFVLLGVNPYKRYLDTTLPVFAGNVSKPNVTDYTKNEQFAVKNAYLTAEGTISLMIKESDFSLINSNILILGYGRIGKALHKYLNTFTKNITVCARSEEARCCAFLNGAETIDFSKLNNLIKFDYIINTVPHPVLNKKELSSVSKSALLIDLASFPGGIDIHYSKAFELNTIVARGLPAQYSPMAAGNVVGETVLNLITEVIA